MRWVPRALRDTTVTYDAADLVSVAVIGAAVTAWTSVASGAFSALVFVVCQLAFFTFYAVGSLLSAWTTLAAGVLFDLPLRLLIGYGVINTALLALAWLSPLGMLGNFALLCLLTVLLAVGATVRRQSCTNAASRWLVALCLVATTLWCQDSIDPIVEQENWVLFKPWVDGFYHAVHIRSFADSHGASTIEDFRMSGVPARLYHYGVYMLPALVKQASGISSYAAFAAVLAPVGVLFTGFAAYAFIGSMWGAWPGLAAATALLLMPDGAQQGFGNPFMSYQWLTQISPSATYGLALLAVAWLFVIRGCTGGNRLQLLAGWSVAAVLVAYKLHYVVASALLLLVIPALFFRAKVGIRGRALWVALACGFYFAALWLGQTVPGVPIIRLDGSGAREIMHLVHSFHVPGALQQFFSERVGRDAPGDTNLLYGVPYVLLAVLGSFTPLLVLLVVLLRRRSSLLCVVFPIALILNFLVMFFGLALDFESSTPDELSHRPLMIVYFFVTAWVGGGLGYLLSESVRWGRFTRYGVLAGALALIPVPALLGPGVQLMWVMPKISPVRLPTALVRTAEYIRTHGTPDDLFQDSQFDRIYAIAALSERKTFVAHTLTNMPFRADDVAKRTAAVDRIMSLKQLALVQGTARAFGIRWFVLQLGNQVQWPEQLAQHPVFEMGAFRVYEF